MALLSEHFYFRTTSAIHIITLELAILISMEPPGENSPGPNPEITRPPENPIVESREPTTQVKNSTSLDLEALNRAHDITVMQKIRQKLSVLSGKKEPTTTPESDSSGKLDALVVLSEGWKKLKDENLGSRASTESRMRALAAGELYRAGVSDKIIITGGVINSQSRTIAEEMQRYLLTHFKDIPPEAVILEQAALSTRDNAKKIKEMVERQGLKNIGILTSATHLKRAERIFRRFGMNIKGEYTAEDVVKQRRNRKGEISDRHRKFVEKYEKTDGKSGINRERALNIIGILDRSDRVGHAFAVMNMKRQKPPTPPKK